MSRSLLARLHRLEHRNASRVSTPHIVMHNGEPWRMVGRGLLVPP